MIDRKSNIIIVAGFLIIFTIFYGYSLFGVGLINQDNLKNQIIENTFEEDMNIYFIGKAEYIMDLLVSIGGSATSEIPESTSIITEMMNQIYVKGNYGFDKNLDVHSFDIAFTDQSYGFDLLNLLVYYENNRMYFSAKPLLPNSYYYDSQSNSEQVIDLKDNLLELIDQESLSSDFTKREGYDGKYSFVYELKSILWLNDTSYTDITFYIKPEGSIFEILIGTDEAPLSLYFVDKGISLDVNNFVDAVPYDISDISNVLLDYAEEILE